MAELRTIGNFELLGKIGQGGMGTVFKARQISMDRIVAVKVLPPSMARQQKFIERFLREARASARLNHPNIVNGIDVGQENGLYYFAMELVEGQSLKDIVEKEKLSEKRVLEITIPIARALAHAHANGILHRDIKPDNILVDNDGIPKLCDLGLARLDNDDDKSLTQQGQAVGTPHYIAPEQARGERDLDPRTDLYSLGATMYHMLTGKTMFDGPTSVVVMTKHITEKAPLPSEHGAQCSKHFLAVLAKLLTKDRNERYESASIFADELERIAAGKPPLKAELPNSKWPFLGGAPGGAKKAAAGPAQVANAEKTRYTRRETRQVSPVKKFVGPVIAVIVLIGGAAAYQIYVKPAMDAANGAETKPLPTAAPAIPPPPPPPPATQAAASTQSKPTPQLTPPDKALGFKKPVVSAPTPPKADTVGFKPHVASAAQILDKQPEKSADTSKTASASPPDEHPKNVESVKVSLPEINHPPPQKIAPGSELANFISKALLLSTETKYREAAELFKVKPEKLSTFDEFDRPLVPIHAEGYAGLAEMKTMVLERLQSNPVKLDATKVLTKRNLTGKILGGDEKSLIVKDQQVEMRVEWQRLAMEEIQNLVTQSLGVIPPQAALGFGVLYYDQNDDVNARKVLATLSTQASKKILEIIDLRDKALIAKKLAEMNASAEKLFADAELAMSTGNFANVVTKITTLRAKYPEAEIVEHKAAAMEQMFVTAKICEKFGATIEPGNVALATNGAVPSGMSYPANLNDGLLKATGNAGFAWGPIPCELVLTLKKIYMLKEIRMLLWDISETRYYQYKIETSIDGENFQPLGDFSRGEYRSWQTLVFPMRPVKAIKVKGLHNSGNTGFHIVELEAYCFPPETPVAPKAPSVIDDDDTHGVLKQ